MSGLVTVESPALTLQVVKDREEVLIYIVFQALQGQLPKVQQRKVVVGLVDVILHS